MASETPVVQQPGEAVVDGTKQPEIKDPMIVHHVAVPLNHLREFAATVDCPSCGNREQTSTSTVAGSRAECAGWLICCFLTPLLAWVPCVIPACKDVEHHCGVCKTKLAVWPRGSKVTEVVARPSPLTAKTTQSEKQELAKDTSMSVEEQGVVTSRPEGVPDRIEQHPQSGTIEEQKKSD